MKTLSIDIETYSEADLSRTGVYRYAEDPSFEILLFGYAVDGGEVRVVDIASGEKIPEDVLLALTDDAVTKTAFNANFERVCLSRYLLDLGISPNHLSGENGRFLSPRSWRCTMVWSAYLGLPLSLAGAGAVLGLEKQKLESGKDLIRYFCRPCVPTQSNRQRTRNLPEHAPEKWGEFVTYNKRDVETEMEIQHRLAHYPVPEQVWDQYCIDQEINDRGILLDLTLVENAIRMDAQSHAELTEKMRGLTQLDNPSSVQQMKRWLLENGMEVESLGKKQVAALLKDAPPLLRDVLSLRLQLARSSVKKYQAMQAAACSDGRVRGMFQFYGANRTGRFSSKIVQMQNLAQNHLPDLEVARDLVRSGDYEGVKEMYGDVPDTLSQLVRTAFVAREGKLFYVADFSAIEARVIAYLANEKWRMDLFASGGDIYCQSASKMFKCNVVKNGENGHLRVRGKISELACLAFDSKVLTDQGLVPIQDVTLDMKLWDGEEWVTHEGVIYKGEREVITYGGLTATPDHLVYVEGFQDPTTLEQAKTRRLNLIKTGNGRTAVRLSDDNLLRNDLSESALADIRSCQMREVRHTNVERPYHSSNICDESLLSLSPQENTQMAGSEAYCSKTTLREPKRQGIQKLRKAGNPVRFSECNSSGSVFNPNIRNSRTNNGTRSNQYRWPLRSRKSEICRSSHKLHKPAQKRPLSLRIKVLALCPCCCNKETFERDDARRNHPGCEESCSRKAKELAWNRRTARVYDIRNAGRHHRFTVSDVLVHNCGYGGGVGALKAMGAIEMGLSEDELLPLVQSWRAANPHIVQFWWDVDAAAMTAVKQKTPVKTHGIMFTYRSGMLFITLPSGRNLAYVKPAIGENQFGSPTLTYLGIGGTKKWERLETYGPKISENVCQAVARDILCNAMTNLRHCSIVAHVHDELIIEADPSISLKDLCEQMSRTPPWAEGLLLNASGYVTPFYKKD